MLSHTSDGWRHASTYRRINVYKPLFIMYVRTYTCIYVFLFAYTVFRCSILYESYTVQCIIIVLPGKRIHLFDKKKKEKVKLGSSYKRKYVHELLVNRLFKPAQEKVWLCELTVPQ